MAKLRPDAEKCTTISVSALVGGVVLFAAGFWVLYVVFAGQRVNASNSIFTRLRVLYVQLKEVRKASFGEPVGKEVELELRSDGEYFVPGIGAYYYPRAWDEPGRVLLKYGKGDYYYLVFGNGSQAMVACYLPPEDEDEYIQPTMAERYGRWVWWLIPLAGGSIAFALFRQQRASVRESEVEGLSEGQAGR